MANMFAQAKVVEAPKPATKASKKETVTLRGLEDYAVCDSLIKNLTAIQETLKGPIHDQMKKHFIAQTQPENFNGVDGLATASAEARKRSTKSALNEEEQASLTAAGIPFDIEEPVAEHYFINPELANDSAFLEKVSKALEKVPGMRSDFIQKQAGVKKAVVSKETVREVYAKGLAEKFFDTVITLALKPKLENADIATTVAKARKILGLKEEKKEGK